MKPTLLRNWRGKRAGPLEVKSKMRCGSTKKKGEERERNEG